MRHGKPEKSARIRLKISENPYIMEDGGRDRLPSPPPHPHHERAPMKLKKAIRKTKFILDLIVLGAYALYTVYAVYYYLSYDLPLRIVQLVLVFSVLGFYALLAVISYRVNRREKPSPKSLRIIKICKYALQVLAAVTAVILFVAAAQSNSVFPWISAAISIPLELLAIFVNVIAERRARGLGIPFEKKVFVPPQNLDEDGEKISYDNVIANIKQRNS